ncbi:MAG: sortase, partial [Acidimicrobiales bacterium]
NLNQMNVGDPIFLTTIQGRFRYNVVRSLVVAPSDIAVAGHTTANQVTLTTCTPRFSAAQRLVVQADLVGAPTVAASPAPTHAAPDPSLGGTLGDWVPAFWWGLLVAGLLAATLLIGRRAPTRKGRVGAYLLATPVLLLVLLFFFENLSPLLPASF